MDAETGISYYRHRVYHAQLGRFISRDPIGYRGGVSVYLCARSQAIDHVDPTGMIPPGADPWNAPGGSMRTPWPEKTPPPNRERERHFVVVAATCKYDGSADTWAETVPSWLAYPWPGTAIPADTIPGVVDGILNELDENDTIGSIQFWGNGSPGHMSLANDSIAIEDLAATSPLAKIRSRLSPTCKIVFKGCNVFSGREGQRFAERAANFFDCIVGGHAALIGYWLRYPEYHELAPGQKAHWPLHIPNSDVCKDVCQDCDVK